METIKEMEADKKIIEQKYEEVNRLNQELNRKIKQLTAIQETGKAILSVLDLDQLLERDHESSLQRLPDQSCDHHACQ